MCSDIVHKMLRQKEGKIQTNESNLKGWWSFGCTLFTSDVLVQANICMYCITEGYKDIIIVLKDTGFAFCNNNIHPLNHKTCLNNHSFLHTCGVHF